MSANVLLSGPAGGGKSAAARRERAGIEAAGGPAVIVDFQSLYAALTGDQRGSDGRYPERDNPVLLPIVEHMRQHAIIVARERDIGVVATNSEGGRRRREYLLGLLGPGAVETVVDPGRAAVVAHLAVDGALSPQCEIAIGRWYNRLV